MSDSLRKQIHKNFDHKETEILLDIWQKNDRTEWSNMAFEVLETIINERQVELPPQNEPINEYIEEKPSSPLSEKAKKLLELLQRKYTPEDEATYAYLVNSNEGFPAFYSPKEVLKVYDWLNKIAIAIIPLYIIIGVTLTLKTYVNIVGSYFINAPVNMSLLIWLIALVLVSIGIALQIALTYYPLKALAHILRILMEFEYRSRGIKPQITSSLE